MYRYNFRHTKQKKSNKNIIIFLLCICCCIIISILIGGFIYYYYYYVNKKKLINQTPSNKPILDTKTETTQETTQESTEETTQESNPDTTSETKPDATTEETKKNYEKRPPSSIEAGESKTLLEKIKDDPVLKALGGLAQNPHFYAAIGVQIGMVEAVKLALYKMRRQIVAAQVKKLFFKSSQVAVKAVLPVLSKLGVKAGIAFAEKAAIKIGAKLAANATMAASTGPAAPFVAAAFLAFDVLSIGLDLGDAGGYDKMGQKSEYIKIRDGINQKFKEEVEHSGEVYPLISGPLDKLSEDDLQTALNDIIDNILNHDKDPPDDLIKPMITKMTEDIVNKKLTLAGLHDEETMKQYQDLIDQDQVSAKAMRLLCQSLKGKIINNGDITEKCSYPDKESCDSSYSWPLKEDSNETYAEFKSDQFGGACIKSSFAVKAMCKDNSLNYDSDKGICNITEEYCSMKGAKWKYNDTIKENDCHIDDGQKLAEMIFGTTITRGLIQLFDPNQYEPCRDGETDDGYFCRSVGCNNDEDHCNNAGVCYPKCEPGFHNSTCFTCISDCPEGYVNTGVATCSKGGEVYAKSSYPAHKQPCPDGQRDDGTSCWEHIKCEFIWGFIPKHCSGGNMTKTLFDRTVCNPGDTNVAGICWPNCREGYHDDGAFCRRPIETITRTTKGLGAGRPAVKTRVKKRRIAFSTKDN